MKKELNQKQSCYTSFGFVSLARRKIVAEKDEKLLSKDLEILINRHFFKELCKSTCFVNPFCFIREIELTRKIILKQCVSTSFLQNSSLVLMDCIQNGFKHANTPL